MDWSKATSTTTSTNELGTTFTRDLMPARYTGRRSEFYSGVTPGAEGIAERVTLCTGSYLYSFSVGGAWMSVPSDEVLEELGEVTE